MMMYQRYVWMMVAAVMMLFSSSAYALDLQKLNQEIDAFTGSAQARFVPVSIKRLLAYQGATMLAYEQQKSSMADPEAPIAEEKQSKALKNALEQTAEAFADVKSNAAFFQTSNIDLLLLEKEAEKAYRHHHSPKMMPNADVKKHYETAKMWLNKCIEASELGQLNVARQSAKKATLVFEKSMDAAMSGLVEQTSRTMSAASAAGAKRYTPRLWAIAKAEFGLLKRYHENQQAPSNEKMLIKRPEKPGYAFEMAMYAKTLALQVKKWRRDKGSHEQMFLEARQQRVDVAKALGIALDETKVGVDVEVGQLLKHIRNLKDTLRQEREHHQAQTVAMNAAFAQGMRDALYTQRIKAQKSFQEKMATIKQAFRAKLEQETFESKRQSKLRALFAEDEVEVLAKLNGSLVIRTKNIQFESASSKLDSDYFDLLSRIKEALDLYPERQITIEGHTDNIGNAKVNRALSLKRAEAVQEFFIAANMDAERLNAVGYGEAKPIATNMYKQGRAMNRRIDFVIEAANHE